MASVNPNIFPEGVIPTGDNGVYLVKSRSRPHISPWRVDVQTFECRCERGQIGKSAAFRKNQGYLPYKMMCEHLKLAIAYDGILLRMMLEERNLAQ